MIRIILIPLCDPRPLEIAWRIFHRRGLTGSAVGEARFAGRPARREWAAIQSGFCSGFPLLFYRFPFCFDWKLKNNRPKILGRFRYWLPRCAPELQVATS